jgi:hypothetical protein
MFRRPSTFSYRTYRVVFRQASFDWQLLVDEDEWQIRSPLGGRDPVAKSRASLCAATVSA